MNKYNEIRLKMLEGTDALAILAILLLASGIDTTEPMTIVKALLIPSGWLLARYFANH